MKPKTIHLGYEIGTGRAVEIPLHHLVITGLTQLSGKTTTLEALIQRSGLRALAFRTKRGELGFEGAHRCRPYFKERSDWQYVAALLEATMKERLKFERSWIIKLCKGTKTLREVYDKLVDLLEPPEGEKRRRLRGLDESVYTTLRAYLDIVLPQIEAADFTDRLDLEDGLNVMDLVSLSLEVQSLVIQSVIQHVHRKMKNVIVVIPEAAKFLPQKRGSPVKVDAELLIREGAAIGNYLWIDTQDIAGVDKTPLKNVDVWILGRQRERNEVKTTLDHLPEGIQKPRPSDILKLKVGHFYASAADFCVPVYVQPKWLDAVQARGVAEGKLDAAKVSGPDKPNKLAVAMSRIDAIVGEVERLEERNRDLEAENAALALKTDVKRAETLEEEVAELAGRLEGMRDEVARAAETNEALKMIRGGLERLGLAQLHQEARRTVDGSPSAVLEMWLHKLDKGPARVLSFLVEKHPMKWTRTQLATATGYKATGGAYQRCLRVLRDNDLVAIEGKDVRINPQLVE